MERPLRENIEETETWIEINWKQLLLLNANVKTSLPGMLLWCEIIHRRSRLCCLQLYFNIPVVSKVHRGFSP